MVNFSIYDERTETDQAIRRAYGGTVAGPVWNHFMTYVTQDLPVEEFPPAPEGTETFFRTPKTEVPNVSGMSQREAKDAIYKAGLRANISDVASLEPEGTFLDQSPRGGAEVTQGSVVSVRYSSGVPPALLDLSGLPLADVQAAVDAFNEELGLNLSFTIENVPTDEPSAIGFVVGTNPPAGTLLEADQAIVIYVGVPDLGD
jgi:beta-lactam-binding protein with PASTA domain